VNAGYAQINPAQNTQLATPVTIDNRKQWQLGVSVPFGDKDFIAVNYASGKNTYNNVNPTWGSETSSMWGVAYFHDLSKRTNLYVAYGDISQDKDDHTRYGLDGQDSYRSAFQVGMKHSF